MVLLFAMEGRAKIRFYGLQCCSRYLSGGKVGRKKCFVEEKRYYLLP